MFRFLVLFYVFISFTLFGQEKNENTNPILNSQNGWKLVFNDSGSKKWKSKWFLDGLQADIKNTKEGMAFSAGSKEGDDACHAVLWTKDSFKGDIKIEYDYTRIDSLKSQVNILYIQATGVAPFDKDISKWNNYRIIPHMKTYFNHMHCLHISYAAYDSKGNEYIRLRKYPKKLNDDFNTTTEILPAYFDTNLFIPGETYKITVIKTADTLLFNVEGKNEKKCFSWKLDTALNIKEGRIGLRHMYTRSSLYKNFKIFIKK